MKTIVAGPRDFTDRELVFNALTFAGEYITEVVSGGAKGVDALGEAWARENLIPIRRFPADWDYHGRKAGPIRNRQMAEYADQLLAFWDGESKGTGNMIRQAKARGLNVVVWPIGGVTLDEITKQHNPL